MSGSTLTRIMEDGKDQLRIVLPALHNAAEAGTLTLPDLHAHLAPQIESFRLALDPVLTQLDQPMACKALQLIVFPVASLERHHQSAGAPPGVAIGRLTGIDTLLTRLGAIADRPPQNSHYSYWRENDGPAALTFTGDPQESFFGRVVNQQARLQGLAVQALRPICTGDVGIDSVSAVESLRAAMHSIATLYMEHYRNFTRPGSNGQPGMTGEFFRTRFRTNLVRIPILGVMWPGPNATNIKEQPTIDHMTFGVDPWYDEVIRERFRHFSKEGREAVEADLQLPSVLDRFLDRLGLSRHELLLCASEEIERRVAEQTDSFCTSLDAFKEFYLSSRQVSNLHAQLINKWLDVDSPSSTEGPPTKLTVDSNVGVSGTPLEHALRINHMRTEHPVLRTLLGRFTRTRKR